MTNHTALLYKSQLAELSDVLAELSDVLAELSDVLAGHLNDDLKGFKVDPNTAVSSDRSPRFLPLYDDAVDIGIQVTNPKTGRNTRWFVSEVVRDKTDENELQGWLLKPTPETVRRLPFVEGWTMFIAND